MFARTTFSLLLLCSLVVAAGCDGCAEDPAGTDGTPGDLPPNHNQNPGNGDDNGDDEDDRTPESRELAFNGTGPIDVFYGQQQELAFTLSTRAGTKVSGATVRFALTGEAGTLNVLEAATDANGVARVIFTASDVDGSLTLRASADRADDVTVGLNVKVNPVGTLRVAVSSQTRIPVTRAELLVFRGPAQNTPTCQYLASTTTVPTATFAADLAAVPGNRTFTDQPHGASVTVLVSGYSAAGDLIGSGCSDGSGIIGGQTTTLTVAIQQLPTVLAGDYDVLMEVDLGQALPEPYETYVDTTTAILSDPAGFALYHALKQYRSTWWVKDTGDGTGEREHSYREVVENPQHWPSYRNVQPIIDGMLQNQLGQSYVTVKTVGGDVRSAITAFEVGSRFSLAPTATAEVYDVTEQWKDIVFTWRHGCPPGDTGCARRPVQLNETNYAPVTTEYAALATHRPLVDQSERFEVVSEPHLFALRYGAVIMIAFNEVVFPNLPGNLAANSLEGVLNNLVNCASVGQALSDLLVIVTPSVAANLCEDGLDFAGAYIENLVLDLEVGGGNPEIGPKEQTGALGGGVFYLVDADQDLATELVRELEMQVQWNDADAGANEDILAPILGEGRLKTDGCDADAACAAGLYCQAIPHYLKVKQAEQTCARPVGDVLGEEPCTADAQCASGICVGDSAGVPGTCFSACESDDACGLGTCQSAAAFLDLEPVLPGLGEASLSSCML